MSASWRASLKTNRASRPPMSSSHSSIPRPSVILALVELGLVFRLEPRWARVELQQAAISRGAKPLAFAMHATDFPNSRLAFAVLPCLPQTRTTPVPLKSYVLAGGAPASSRSSRFVGGHLKSTTGGTTGLLSWVPVLHEPCLPAAFHFLLPCPTISTSQPPLRPNRVPTPRGLSSDAS
jgi:hypothetical protein